MIENVEILSRDPGVNSFGENCTIIKQKVTYIDKSVKEFTIYMTLSGFPISDEIINAKKKVKGK